MVVVVVVVVVLLLLLLLLRGRPVLLVCIAWLSGMHLGGLRVTTTLPACRPLRSRGWMLCCPMAAQPSSRPQQQPPAATLAAAAQQQQQSRPRWPAWCVWPSGRARSQCWRRGWVHLRSSFRGGAAWRCTSWRSWRAW